ncbi:hypothetical protein QYE77_15065 (plasmid) [Thermanaerothrix sp. 4228-RoL]|uniref:Prepilin type IV endopeptidase peptidase domain-containing protein n=1 Tax=Thermanaerothrix solaris TaxID=3058434 RepID=A0ABU3NRY4_9CHLR|nr:MULTISPECIES: hypothetical protein [unclassified Thermanaerothrix]MDT8899584.1 hypothetical protein [Thermanaerothrix sp. 4228-RoL]
MTATIAPIIAPIWLWLLAISPPRTKYLTTPALLAGLFWLSLIETPERAPITIPAFTLAALTLGQGWIRYPAIYRLFQLYPLSLPVTIAASATTQGLLDENEFLGLVMTTFAFPWPVPLVALAILELQRLLAYRRQKLSADPIPLLIAFMIAAQLLL